MRNKPVPIKDVCISTILAIAHTDAYRYIQIALRRRRVGINSYHLLPRMTALE